MVLKKKPTSNLQSTEAKKKSSQSPKSTTVDAVKTQPQAKPARQYQTQTKLASEALEDINPQAEKVLEYARGFLKTGRFTGYKKGIDMCRDVLRDYPDTKYANQARDLLKTVPERYRKRYNVTDEEMGL